MKRMMFAALAAAVAMPALAQTMPAPATPDSTMAPPAATPPAPMPTDTSTTANAAGAMPAAGPMPADGAYPKCSKMVTDHCTENSTRSGARKHSTPRG